jgi:hypothetical protein
MVDTQTERALVRQVEAALETARAIGEGSGRSRQNSLAITHLEDALTRAEKDRDEKADSDE